MLIPRIEDLVGLPEERAVERWFDGRNYRTLRPVTLLVAAVCLVLAPVMASHGQTWQAVVAGTDLVLLAAVVTIRRRSWFARGFRAIVLGGFLVELGLFAALAVPELRIALGLAIFPALLLLLRLRPAEALLLGGAAGAVGTLTVLLGDDWPGVAVAAAQVLGLALPPALAVTGSIALARRERRLFLGRWREHLSRERERARMRDELADARRIQLAMLPATAPAVDWLDLAAVSLPASEVGGDFYDYLELPGDRLAVAIGDVAGHGVAAGLVLSAVKSGLHLLRDELVDPVPVFERLDRLVREAVRWRLFVTLLVAVIDRDAETVRVVSAGHPPALLVSGDGRDPSPAGSSGEAGELLGHGALPLGTRLPAGYREHAAPFRPGDLLLLYSDGLTELAGTSGEMFGTDRLRRLLQRRASRNAAARDVREGLLEAVAHHKHDTPQADDVTLVVVRRI